MREKTEGMYSDRIPKDTGDIVGKGECIILPNCLRGD